MTEVTVVKQKAAPSAYEDAIKRESVSQPESDEIKDRLESILSDEMDDELDLLDDKPVRKKKQEKASDDDDDDDLDLDDDDDDDGELDDDKEPETIAEYFGVQESQVIQNDDGSISIVTNVDGDVKNISLSEVIKGYQIDQYNFSNSQKLSNDRKEFDEEREAIIEEANMNLEMSMQALNQIENDLVADYKLVNWNHLQTEKPDEFQALKKMYSDRAHQLTNAKERAMGSAKKIMDENSKKVVEQQNKDAAKHRNLLITALPALADANVYKTTMTRAKKFMLDTYGVSEDEANAITDSRLIRLILDAQQFHKGKKQLVEKQGGKKLPKFMKPGQRRSRGTAKANKSKAARQRFKETGSPKDAAKLLEDRM